MLRFEHWARAASMPPSTHQVHSRKSARPAFRSHPRTPARRSSPTALRQPFRPRAREQSRPALHPEHQPMTRSMTRRRSRMAFQSPYRGPPRRMLRPALRARSRDRLELRSRSHSRARAWRRLWAQSTPREPHRSSRDTLPSCIRAWGRLPKPRRPLAARPFRRKTRATARSRALQRVPGRPQPRRSPRPLQWAWGQSSPQHHSSA